MLGKRVFRSVLNRVSRPSGIYRGISLSRTILDVLPQPSVQHSLWNSLRIHSEILNKRLIVLDDDPSCCRGIYNVDYLLRHDVEDIKRQFVSHSKAVFISSRSGDMTSAAWSKSIEHLFDNLSTAADIGFLSQDLQFISQKNNILTGNLLETVNIAKLIPQCMGVVFVPSSIDDNIVTLNDVVYRIEQESLVPILDFDKNLSGSTTNPPKTSNVADWIVESSEGSISYDDITSISVKDIREGGPRGVASILQQNIKGKFIIVNAVNQHDVNIFAIGSLIAETMGCNFLYRSSSSFVASRSAIEPRSFIRNVVVPQPSASNTTKQPLLHVDMNKNNNEQLSNANKTFSSCGGIIIAGDTPVNLFSSSSSSHHEIKDLTSNTTIRAFNISEEDFVDESLNEPRSTETLLGSKKFNDFIARTIVEMEECLKNSRNIVLHYSPTNLHPPSSAFLYEELLKKLSLSPSFMIIRGEEQAHHLCLHAMGCHRIRLVGELSAGAFVWSPQFENVDGLLAADSTKCHVRPAVNESNPNDNHEVADQLYFKEKSQVHTSQLKNVSLFSEGDDELASDSASRDSASKDNKISRRRSLLRALFSLSNQDDGGEFAKNLSHEKMTNVDTLESKAKKFRVNVFHDLPVIVASGIMNQNANLLTQLAWKLGVPKWKKDARPLDMNANPLDTNYSFSTASSLSNFSNESTDHLRVNYIDLHSKSEDLSWQSTEAVRKVHESIEKENEKVMSDGLLKENINASLNTSGQDSSRGDDRSFAYSEEDSNIGDEGINIAISETFDGDHDMDRLKNNYFEDVKYSSDIDQKVDDNETDTKKDIGKQKILYFLRDLQSQGQSIMSCRIGNMEQLSAVLKTSGRNNLPVVLEITPSMIDIHGQKLFSMVENARQANPSSVFLAFSNIRSRDELLRCSDLSVPDLFMIDGSSLSHDDNIRFAEAMVSEAKQFGCSVEAKVGKIVGDNAVNPRDVKLFLEESKVDVVAMDVTSMMDLLRLSFIRAMLLHTETPLALDRFSSEWSPEFLREAKKLGVCKMNVGDMMERSLLRGMTKVVSERSLDGTENNISMDSISRTLIDSMVTDLSMNMKELYEPTNILK